MSMDVASFELPKSKNSGLFIGAALVTLLVVGGAIFAFAGGRSEPATPVTPEPAAAAPMPAPTPEPAQQPEPEPVAQANSATPEPAPAEVIVRVKIATKPEGAEVFSDGALLGRTPFELERPRRGEPGLDLTLKLPGYKDQPVRVTAYTQEKLTVELDKKRAGSSAPARPVVAPEPTPAPQQPTPRSEEPARRPRTRPSTEVLDPWN